MGCECAMFAGHFPLVVELALKDRHTFQDHGVCFSSGDGCGGKRLRPPDATARPRSRQTVSMIAISPVEPCRKRGPSGLGETSTEITLSFRKSHVARR